MNYCMVTTLLFMNTYDSGISVRRSCPFDVRAVPMPGGLGINRATRVHYRLRQSKHCRRAGCFVHCFRPSKTKALGVSSKAILLPGSLCPLPNRAFQLCCASTSASRRAMSICFRSDFKRLRRLAFLFGGSGVGRCGFLGWVYWRASDGVLLSMFL